MRGDIAWDESEEGYGAFGVQTRTLDKILVQPRADTGKSAVRALALAVTIQSEGTDKREFRSTSVFTCIFDIFECIFARIGMS